MLAETLSLYDVKDVEGLCQRVIRQSGIELSHHDREDLLAFLVATCWELSLDYEPGIYRKGFAFYAGAALKRRLIDWNRKRFGRTRWQFADRVYERPSVHISSLDQLADAHTAGSVESALPSDPSLHGLLGTGTSPSPRQDKGVGGNGTRRAS